MQITNEELEFIDRILVNSQVKEIQVKVGLQVGVTRWAYIVFTFGRPDKTTKLRKKTKRTIKNNSYQNTLNKMKERRTLGFMRAQETNNTWYDRVIRSAKKKSSMNLTIDLAYTCKHFKWVSKWIKKSLRWRMCFFACNIFCFKLVVLTRNALISYRPIASQLPVYFLQILSNKDLYHNERAT